MWKNITNKYFLVLITLILSVDVSARESNTLAHNDLLKSVISYVEQELNSDNSKNLRVVALPLDTRVSLQKCTKPLNFNMAQNRNFTRQFPVKVKCASKVKPWKVYIQVTVTEMVEALLINQTISKGNTIELDMVEITLVEAHRVRDRSSTDLSSIIGGRALRNLQRGFQIGMNDVCLVCKGDDVAIIARNSSMMIKTSGTAVESGAKGESIKVKNNSSNRIVKGIIGDLRQIYVNL